MDFIERSGFANPGSPARHAPSVRRIVSSFLPQDGRPVRVLDVGGTKDSFARHAALRTIDTMDIVNPDRGAGSDCAYIFDLSPSQTNYDLITFFGVISRIDDGDLRKTLCYARELLSSSGVLLIAEPDGEKIIAKVEIARRKFYTSKKVRELLQQCGFKTVHDRNDLRKHRAILTTYFVVVASK